MIRHDWTLEELKGLHDLPLLQLISKAHQLHIKFHLVDEIQVCSLISIKTGGCTEDCKYCPQSSSYQTPVSPMPLMKYSQVIEDAKKAIAMGASRICLGVAWREVVEGHPFDQMLKMIKGITDLGVEVCCTFGMLKEELAKRLKEAGLYAYNHNLDSSEEFYKTIITTRTYQDRLDTLDVVEKQGLSVCCGGIIGMGESITDRLKLLLTLSKRNPHPESVPINRLSPIPGTPLEHQPLVPIWEFIRLVAIARITLPKSLIRLSCGRLEMSHEAQALSFLAGANSIHAGEKLLTQENTDPNSDEEMFFQLGLKKRAAFKKESMTP